MDKTGKILEVLHLDSQKYLKWHNATVGIINESNRVEFVDSTINIITKLYSKGKQEWSESEFREFLKGTTPSPQRSVYKYLVTCL
jgi:hypothetical protein